MTASIGRHRNQMLAEDMLKTICYTCFALFILHFAVYTLRDTLNNPQRETIQSNTSCNYNTRTLCCKFLRKMTCSTLHSPCCTLHPTHHTLHPALYTPHALYATLPNPYSTHHTLRHTLQFAPRAPQHKACAKTIPMLCYVTSTKNMFR